MRNLAFLLLILPTLFLWGCMGQQRMFSMQGYGEEIVFPNGMVLGGASSQQAEALADIIVKSHNLHMQEFDELKEQNLRTAQQALAMLEDIARNQGSGEITLFFNTGSSTIRRGSLEYERLIRFVDYLSRESRGRKLHFMLVGSASATGSRKVNERLSMARAKSPMDVIDKYLVNIPHEYYTINGVGDMYSPRGVSGKVHGRYQNVRIIAAFDEEDFSSLAAY